MTDAGQTLLDACNSIIHNPDLAPELDPTTEKVLATHCNAGALEVAQAMNCHEFDVPEGAEPLLADQMIWHMRTNFSGRWSRATGSEASIHALSGRLGFAAMSSGELGEDHGHICAVFPAGMQRSGSLKRDVPLVANVGMCNGEEKVSQAFPVSKGEPDYYLYA